MKTIDPDLIVGLIWQVFHVNIEYHLCSGPQLSSHFLQDPRTRFLAGDFRLLSVGGFSRRNNDVSCGRVSIQPTDSDIEVMVQVAERKCSSCLDHNGNK